MKTLHCCENCRRCIIRHSTWCHASTQLCQKFQFYSCFLLLQWSVFISALTLLQCQSPHSHRGKQRLCQEIIPRKQIALQTWLLHWCLLIHALPGQRFISRYSWDSGDGVSKTVKHKSACDGGFQWHLCSPFNLHGAVYWAQCFSCRYCSGGAVGPCSPTGQLQPGKLHLPGNTAQHRQDCFCIQRGQDSVI